MSFLKKTINQNNKIELYKFVGENFVNLSKEYQNESALKVCFLDLETTSPPLIVLPSPISLTSASPYNV